MLPFKYRTHRIKEIEFRNVFKEAQVDQNLSPLNRKYFMEIEYKSPQYKDGVAGSTTKVITSEVYTVDNSSCIFPQFELSKESVRFGPEFRKQFEQIDNP